MSYKKVLNVVGLLLLLVLGYAIYEFVTCTQQRTQAAEQQATETTTALRDRIEVLLNRVTAEGQRLAKDFGENDYAPDEARELVKASALRLPESQGVTVAYEPFAFNKETRLFSPYYDKGAQSFVQVEDAYDYTDETSPKTAWYTNVRDQGAQWVEPYYGTAVQNWYVDLGVPFHFGDGPKKGKVRGTITISFLCRDFGNLIHKFSLGKTGFGFITSSEGTFLAHPNQDFVGKEKLAAWLQEETDHQKFRTACQQLLAGESGLVKYRHDGDSDRTLFCYEQIPSADWGMGVVFCQDDLLDDQASLFRRYINLAILGSLLGVCVLAIVYSLDHLDEREIWWLSVISSALLIANIVLVGWLEHQAQRPPEVGHSGPVTDFSALDQFVGQRNEVAARLRVKQPTVIPTGLHIRRLDFQDSYNLNVGGTVWQKVPLEIAETAAVGFMFPQVSPFAEASLIEETLREKIAGKEGEAGYLLVQWDFRVTLQLNFQYADFPFDKRQINIEIAPDDNSGAVLLVPDLASYDSTTPSSRAGLSDSIVLSGNEITESYFHFSVDRSGTDFGFGPRGHLRQVPVLHYNVHLRRNLLNVFVTYLIPIAVALLMIFILLCACRKTSERQGIIESMAAFIFVLIFSHIDLRKEVVTGELIYLEYFYFITYATVLLTTFNLMAFTLDKTNVFDFNSNQIFKAIYFPLFLFAVLVVTLVKFY